jgi:hypothetical protein
MGMAVERHGGEIGERQSAAEAPGEAVEAQKAAGVTTDGGLFAPTL